MTEPSSLQLTVLGAGPAYTDDPGARGAAYLVSAEGASILLDLGQGAFPPLAARLEPSTLAAVFISHLHPDHFIDLVSLRHYLRYHFEPPRRVTVHAPREIAARLDALHAQTGFTSQSLAIEPLEASIRRVGPFEVAAAPVTHIPDSFGFRVAVGGPGLVYSGDCGRAADLLPLLRPGDTLLAEVSFGPGPVPAGVPHLDGPAVGAIARQAGAARVLLTHLQMGFDRDATIGSVRDVFDGPVELVAPGYETTI